MSCVRTDRYRRYSFIYERLGLTLGPTDSGTIFRRTKMAIHRLYDHLYRLFLHPSLSHAFRPTAVARIQEDTAKTHLCYVLCQYNNHIVCLSRVWPLLSTFSSQLESFHSKRQMLLNKCTGHYEPGERW